MAPPFCWFLQFILLFHVSLFNCFKDIFLLFMNSEQAPVNTAPPPAVVVGSPPPPSTSQEPPQTRSPSTTIATAPPIVPIVPLIALDAATLPKQAALSRTIIPSQPEGNFDAEDGALSDDRSATVSSVVINTLCNIMGGGILALPMTMYTGSIIFCTIALILCSAGAAFSVYLLVYGCDVTNKYSYAESLAHVMFPNPPGINPLEEGSSAEASKKRRWVVMALEAVVFLNNFGLLVIYQKVIQDSMPPVLEQIGAGDLLSSSALWLWLPAIIFFGATCAKNMEELKWSSMVGFVTILYVVLLTAVRLVTRVEVPETKVAASQEINWLSFSFDSLAVMSSYSTAFAYHFNVPYFYRELIDRRPAVMLETVRRSFPIITICYLITALFGYLTFGALVADKSAGGNIMNNYPRDDTFVNVGRFGLFFHFASVFPVMSVCARRAAHRFVCMWKHEDGDGDPSTTTFRSITIEAGVIVLGSTIAAATLPGVDRIVSLIGTLFGIPLLFVLPGMIGMKVFQPPETNHLSRNISLDISREKMAMVYKGSKGLFIAGWFFVVVGLLAFFVNLV